jgi:hypothetical protein
MERDDARSIFANCWQINPREINLEGERINKIVNGNLSTLSQLLSLSLSHTHTHTH